MIPYTVTIDTEEEWDWSGPFPVENLCVDNIRRLPDFQRVCDAHGVRPTYFVNHAVLNDPDAGRVVAELGEREGVEIGMHLHPWNTPPITTLHVEGWQTFVHNLPEPLIDDKLDATWRRFADWGMRPTSFRGGRYSSGERVGKFLAEHGFWVDASVCPYTSWPDAGAPDYRDRSPAPVRRRASNGAPLWEIPLTRAFTRGPERLWRRAFEAVEHSPLAKLRLIGALERLGVVRRVWLNFECESPAAMLQFLRRRAGRAPAPLCFTVHSSSLSVGPGPYCQTEEDRRRIFDGVEQVFRYLAESSRFQPMTMTELAQTLEAQAHEGSRHQPVG